MITNNMKITVLGCGASGGVPLIGNVWGNCDPNNPKNRRTRCSIFIEDKNVSLLVDTSPDIREQFLRHNIQNLDAVIYTHSHADHCHGIDDLRSLNWLLHKSIPVYSDSGTLDSLSLKFPYIFEDKRLSLHNKDCNSEFYVPAVETNPLVFDQNGIADFSVNGLNCKACMAPHGYTSSLILRFGDFAYATDVSVLDEKVLKMLFGTKVLLLECIRIQHHGAHINLEKALHYVDIIKPEKTFLTHMNQDMDYQNLCDILPLGVLPAYDGLEIKL